jgi:hypothetical protein
MTTAVYIPLAREFRLLPIQVAAVRRFLAGVSRIVVVQTPPGKSFLSSGGPWRLRRQAAEQLGVEMITAPDFVAGQLPRERIGRLNRWLWRDVIGGQSEPLALVLSGDVLPLRALDVPSLLQGRGLAHRHPLNVWTWLALDRRRAPADVAWDADAQRWDARPLTLELAASIPLLAAAGALPADCRCEYLEPGLLHLDKLTTRASFALRKLAYASAVYGVPAPAAEEITETLPPGSLRAWPLDPDPLAFWTGRRSEPSSPATSPDVVSSPKTAISAAADADRWSHLVGEQRRRYAICRGCPDLATSQDGLISCRSLDDNRSSQWNCARSRHGRYIARLTSQRPGCQHWRPIAHAGTLVRSPCPVCSLRDPLPEPEISGRPLAWRESDEVRQQHVAALAAVAAASYAPPADLAGDGILYCGEGRFWPGIVIGVRLLRDTGCRLPVQIWHNGPIGHELDNVDGVRLVDAAAFRRGHPARILRGWEIKTWAILHSGFRRIFYLDADAYAVNDPTPLFSLLDQSPLAFWADLECCRDNVQWPWYGLPATNLDPIQGGQLLIDLAAFWRETTIAHWINMHSDYFYGHQFGDQDSWKVAWALTAAPLKSLGRADWERIAFVCRHQGVPYIVHRCRAKLYAATSPNRWDALPREKQVFEIFSQFQPAGMAAARHSRGNPHPEAALLRAAQLRSRRHAALLQR